MFDVGIGEMFIIAVVALIVLGPERLPKAARFVGLWVRKARAQWYSVKSEFEREMASEELRRSLAQPAADLRREVEAAGKELHGAVRELEQQAAPAAIAAVVADSEAVADAAAASAPPAGIAAPADAASVPEADDRQASLFAMPAATPPRHDPVP